MSGPQKLTRRDFLKRTGQAGGGLMLATHLPSVAAAARDTLLEPNVFIQVRSDSTVRIVCHRSEMGQGIRTSLQQIFADELEADWDTVELVQAVGDQKYGDQNTDGSTSIRRHLKKLRQAGASARQLLEQAAANTWGVDRSECKAQLNEVVHSGSSRRLAYGDLVADAAELEVPSEPDLKSPDQFRYIGKSLDSVDGIAMTTGTANYGIDTVLPGMVYASVERSPVLGGTPRTFDEDAALAVPGVEAVLSLPEATSPVFFNPIGGLAVIASNTWAAQRGRAALNVDWTDGDNASYSSDSYRSELFDAVHKDGFSVLSRGDVEEAFVDAEQVVEADYYAPHLAQAPMEPPAATAVIRDDGHCEVWACTQAPQAARRTVAQLLGVGEDKVTIHVTLLGGGFGRKSKADFVAEAAWLAKRTGKPVKVTWTREDDIRHGFLHSVSGQYLKAGLDKDGNATSWLHRSAFPPIGSTFSMEASSSNAFEKDLGLVDNPFAIPNMQVEVATLPAHVRIGWLRSVANIFHAFAASSFADEMAYAAGADPKDYLLRLIGPPRQYDPADDGARYGNYGQSIDEYPIDTKRMADTVNKVSDMAGWGRELPDGRGLGIAVHRSFLSYVAVVAEVATDEAGKLAVDKLWMAIDAGQVINPDRVKSQLEGGGIFGVSLTLHSGLTAENGRIVEGNFDTYPVARMSDTPTVIETHIMDVDAPPGGVGEPGVPPVAPAITNAYFAATGRRLRNLPLREAGVV
ncbi:MAG: molybdopterin-dependent oxidoreductase [Woeseiaceae bacterium]|nr:molybdopterin-dependent oxidoreductase [Woeseiaceae bacterium]